jgi:uncharacterized membrane protein
MIGTEVSKPARILGWFPLACFVALLATMSTAYILPPDRHLAFAIVEWVEMLVGTVSAVIAFVVLFLWPRVTSPDIKGWGRHEWLAISGLGIWFIFWLIALAARRWAD